MRSICADMPALPGSLSSMDSLLELERRDADRRGRVLDGYRKTDADEHVLFGRVEDRRDDADDRAVRGHQRAAGASRIRRRIELDQIDHVVRAVARTVDSPQARNHARGYRRADAEREADGDDLVSRGEIGR